MSPRENEKGSSCEREEGVQYLVMPRQTLFGAGYLSHVGEAAAGLGKRAFLITGPAKLECEKSIGERMPWNV